MDFGTPNSEDVRLEAAGPGLQPPAPQVSPDSILDTVLMPPGSWNSLPTPPRSILLKHWPAISGNVKEIGTERSLLDLADIIAAERALAQAEVFGTASEKTMQSRAIALTEAREIE